MTLRRELALRLIGRWANALRAMECSVALRTTYGVDKLTQSYDTLVLTTTGDTVQAPVVQAALRVWYALSRCEGYSFRQNFGLWCRGLGVSRGLNASAHVAPVVLQSFPRVVMFWDRWKDDLAIESLRTTFLDVFDASEELQAEAESDLATLRPFIARHGHGVACFVRVSLDANVTKTKAAFRLLSSRLVELTAWEGPELVLSGIEIAGRQRSVGRLQGLNLGEMKALRTLCDALPPGMGVDMRFPEQHRKYSETKQDAADTRAFRSFLCRVVGLEGSEFLGRTQVLDFINAFPDNLLAQERSSTGPARDSTMRLCARCCRTQEVSANFVCASRRTTSCCGWPTRSTTQRQSTANGER